MPLPYGLPIHAQSIIGYAIYRLEHGDSPEAVLEKIRAKEEYGDQSNVVVENSIRAAQDAIADLRHITQAEASESIREVLGAFAQGLNKIGFRVLAEVQFPDGHTEHVSVIVNAGSNATKRLIENYVTALVNSGRLGGKSGRPYPVTVQGDPQIYQVLVGGYQGAFEI